MDGWKWWFPTISHIKIWFIIQLISNLPQTPSNKAFLGGLLMDNDALTRPYLRGRVACGGIFRFPWCHEKNFLRQKEWYLLQGNTYIFASPQRPKLQTVFFKYIYIKPCMYIYIYNIFIIIMIITITVYLAIFPWGVRSGVVLVDKIIFRRFSNKKVGFKPSKGLDVFMFLSYPLVN